MLRQYSTLVLFLLFSVTGVSAQPDTNDYPTYDPSQSLYVDLDAQLLAEEVKQLYGGAYWNDSLLISFDFVSYTKDDKETARYHQEWNRLTDEALLSGVLDDGRDYEVRFASLSKQEGMMVVDSVPIPDAHLAQSLKTAYQQITTNVRWLMLPVQLFDPNVSVHRLQDTAFAGKGVTTLQVSFAPDSLMPYESFILYVNKAYKNIERSRPIQRGVKADYIWRLYRRVGPFLISTKRWADDFKSYIKLENIKIIQLTPDEIARRSKDSQGIMQQTSGTHQ